MARKKYPSMKGKHYAPHPLDFAIIERLPPEGSVLGYHVLASTVKRLADDLNKDVPEEGQVTSNNISGRLVSMKVEGLVVGVRILGRNNNTGWQRTRKGELFYSEQTGKQLENGPPSLKAVEGGRA